MSDDRGDIHEYGTGAPTPAMTRSLSPLEALKARIDERATAGAPIVTLPVPGLDGVQVRYRCQVSGSQREAWFRQAARRSQDNPKGLFQLHVFAWLVLAHCCEAILVAGEPLVDDAHGGVEATFASKVVQDMLGAGRATEAVAALYSADGACVATATDVMQAAGWAGIDSTDEGPEDPT